MKRFRVGVVGATGYLGTELVRALLLHPHMEVHVLSSLSGTGEETLFPSLSPLGKVPLHPPDSPALSECDLVFFATPSGVARERAGPLLKGGVKVVDLSGDHRLENPTEAQRWYGSAPTLPPGSRVSYGLPELFRGTIRDSHLVANPGCYPTSALLALYPLAQEGLLRGRVVIDSKSGASGAGKDPTSELHFPRMNEGLHAYKVEGHRHEPEIQEKLVQVGGEGVSVLFVPHIVPMNRGILSTIYAPLSGPLETRELQAIFEKAYSSEPFVRLVRFDPDPAFLRGTNVVDLKVVGRNGLAVLFVALDNLGKGGALQAIQNANLLLGLPESEGLDRLGGVFP